MIVFNKAAVVCWLSIGAASLLAGCERPDPVVLPLLLVAPATLTPTASTARVGDTLWVEARYSDSLLDLNSNRRYRIRPQDIALRTSFAASFLHGNGQPDTGAASTLQVVPHTGQAQVNGSFTGRFEPEYDGRSYYIKFGLVPTQRGVLAISLLLVLPGGARDYGYILPFMQLPPDAQGREQKAAIEFMYFIINGGQADNYDLYCQQATVNPQTANLPPKSLIYPQQSTFTVEVK